MPSAPLLVTLRALGMGDLLTALPALRGLAAAFPEHRRVLAAPAWVAPIASLDPAFGEVAPTEPLQPLDPALQGADVAVNLHGRGPESHRVLLAGRPRRLIAFGHPEEPSVDGPVHQDHEHEVVRWCRLLQESGIPADADALDLVAPEIAVPEAAVDATVLHVGASTPSKRWPSDRWAEVARCEREAGHRVVITGGPADVAAAAEVATLAGLLPAAVLAGVVDLVTLAAVVAAARRVVSVDTGLAHLATALRTPSVILFGPVSPSLWGPPANRPWHRALWDPVPSADPHEEGGTSASGPHPSMLAITVERVVAALTSLPDSKLPAPGSKAPRQATREDGAPAREGARP